MNNLIFSDLHLNFLSENALDNFFNNVQNKNPDNILLLGDIADGKTIISILERFSKINSKIFYVLGNHDFYWSSFYNIYEQCKKLPSNLYLLDHEQPLYFDDNTCIIGSSGWYDAGWMKPILPFVYIADWFAIADLQKFFTYSNFHKFCLDLTNFYTKSLQLKLINGLSNYDNIIMLTHFPPLFKTHDNKAAHYWWKPYDSCKKMYDMIIDTMKHHPNKKLTIYAGHTHDAWQTKLLDNVVLNVEGCCLGNPNNYSRIS